MNGYPRTKKGQRGEEDYRGKKTVLLHLVFYTLSVGHLLNILVEKPSRQLDIRFETQPRKNQAR